MSRVAAAAYAVLVVVFVALGGGDQEPHGAHALKLTVINYKWHQDRLKPFHALNLTHLTGSKVVRRLNPVKLITKAKDYLHRRFGRPARVAPENMQEDFVHQHSDNDALALWRITNSDVAKETESSRSETESVIQTARQEQDPYLWEDVKADDATRTSSGSSESEIHQTETVTVRTVTEKQKARLESWKDVTKGPQPGMRVEVWLEPNEIEPQECWLLRSTDENMCNLTGETCWEALCILKGKKILANEIKYVSESNMELHRDPIWFDKLARGDWVLLNADAAAKLLVQDNEVDPLWAVCWILEDPDHTASDDDWKLKVICPRATDSKSQINFVKRSDVVTPLGKTWTFGLVQPGILVRAAVPLMLQKADWKSVELEIHQGLSCWLLKKVEGYKWENKLWKAYCGKKDEDAWSNNILDKKFKKGVFELSEANMEFVREPFLNTASVYIERGNWVYWRGSDSKICKVTQWPEYIYGVSSTKVKCQEETEEAAISYGEATLLQDL